MSGGRKKLSVCQNNVAAFSCCCNDISSNIPEPPGLNFDFQVEQHFTVVGAASVQENTV